MIIAPLVFATLVVGIAKMGDMKMVGRVGGKAMAWFISASLISLLLGMVLVNFFAPGKGTTIKLDDTTIDKSVYSLTKDIGNFKKNISKNENFSYFDYIEEKDQLVSRTYIKVKENYKRHHNFV
jgi:Na+/H+-dicarboxylate symporter